MTKDRTVSAESLPFLLTPSASTAGCTMQESVYQRRVEPRRLTEDAPNILIVLIDDAGPWIANHLRRRGQHRTMIASSARGSPITASIPPPCVRPHELPC